MKSPEELTQAVLGRSKETDGRRILTCAEALSLVAELGVQPIEIGRACDQAKIRLGSCQLGCFS